MLMPFFLRPPFSFTEISITPFAYAMPRFSPAAVLRPRDAGAVSLLMPCHEADFAAPDYAVTPPEALRHFRILSPSAPAAARCRAAAMLRYRPPRLTLLLFASRFRFVACHTPFIRAVAFFMKQRYTRLCCRHAMSLLPRRAFIMPPPLYFACRQIYAAVAIDALPLTLFERVFAAAMPLPARAPRAPLLASFAAFRRSITAAHDRSAFAYFAAAASASHALACLTRCCRLSPRLR